MNKCPVLRDAWRCVLAGVLGVPLTGYGVEAYGFPSAIPNDHAASALALTLGIPMAFNNLEATTQVGEVSPGRGSGQSCRAQDGWCSYRSTPTNSLWFSFQANSDSIAIFVEQAANANLQLALWQANNPANFASYLKLAANDDGNDQYAPGILPMIGLTVGGNYLIQLSGQPGYGDSTMNASSVNTLALADGHLGAGTIGLFRFTLAADIGGTDYLAINSAGSTFDTELGLYDSTGHLVATNNNIDAYRSDSQLRFGFGGSNGLALSAGEYTVVLGGFNTIFEDGKIDTTFPHQGDFRIDIQSTQPVVAPAGSSLLARDGNFLPVNIEEVEIARGFLHPGEVLRFPISFDQAITRADWVAIHTTGSLIDTEIALFDAAGRLVAENNNLSPYNPLSRLGFGFDGDDGATLPAGEYTLALGGFNTIFRDGLDISSSSSSQGEFVVYLQSRAGLNVLSVPEPAGIYFMVAGLVVLYVRHRRVRLMKM